MSENPNQPREYDAVLGGQIPAPADGAVLGGLEGAKRRLASKIEQHRIAALWQIVKYGQEGLDLMIPALKDPSKQVQLAAYKLLQQAPTPSVKEALQGFNPYRFFDCIHTFESIYSRTSESSHIISPDGQNIICCWSKGNFGNPDGTGGCRIRCMAWNLNTAVPLSTSHVKFGSAYHDYLHSLVISPDTQIIIAAGTEYSRLGDTRIDILNLHTGQLIHTLYGHSRWGTDKKLSIAVSQDGKILVSGSQDNTAIVWDLEAGKKLYTLEGHSQAVMSLAIAPDGQTLVSGSQDKTIKVWNLKTGREIRTLTGHCGSVMSVAISPDGQTLVTGDDKSSVKVWDLRTCEEIRTLSHHLYHQYGVSALTISSDGQTLIGCGEGIKVWELRTGELLTILKDGAFSAAISPSGQTIVTRSYTSIGCNLYTSVKVWGVR